MQKLAQPNFSRFQYFLDQWSIEKKLITMVVVPALAAILIHNTIYIIFEWKQIKHQIITSMVTQGEIVSENSKGAILFSDQKDAQRILNALTAQNSIITAKIFLPTGELFAEYSRSKSSEIAKSNNAEKTKSTPILKEGITFSEEKITLLKSINVDNNTIAYIKIDSDFEQLNQLLFSTVSASIILTIVFVIFIFLISKKLQKIISTPILKLVETTHRITNSKDYSIRSSRLTDDEIGLLSDAFNEMLSRIEETNSKIIESENRYKSLFYDSPISLWEQDFSDVKQYLASLTLPNTETLKTFFEENTESVDRCWSLIKTTSVNQSTLQLFKTKIEILLAQGMPPLDSKQSKQAFIHELTALYEGKTTFIGEIMIKNYEGDNLYIQIQLAIAPGHEHNWSKVFVSMVDTTQSKKAEYDKEKLILTLGEKNTELEHYTYTVSHDLKSPLVTLAGFVGLLKKDLKEGKPDRVNKDLNRISEAVSTMEQLLNDLLKLSRVNRLQTPVEYIKPNIAIGEVINMLSINMVDANAKIDIQSPMPTIRMDSTSFKEIFLNLINNALKYRKLDLPVHIKIGTRQEQQQTIFFVQDNGIGIEPGYFKKIFGLFERLDNEYEGTGIGLAIVKRIIDIYKGHIWVESDGLNQGATFCFTLPTQNTGKFND